MNLMICQKSAGASLDSFRGGGEGLAAGWLVLDLSPSTSHRTPFTIVTQEEIKNSKGRAYTSFEMLVQWSL